VVNVRTAARIAAIGAGGAALSTGLLAGTLFGQAMLARRTIPGAESPPPRGDGRYGHVTGPPLRLVMLGDSTAAGYGVTKPRQTPGALLATGLAARTRRPVALRTLAVVGATSAMLAPQVLEAIALRPDLAVILVGANDVTHRISPTTSARQLVQAVHALRAAGARVVVGTCPDLGTILPVPRPLRWFARRWSRQMAAAQTVAAVGAGAATVSLCDLLGPRFAADPVRMFGGDRFHPSIEGYAAAAAVLLPTVVSQLTGDAPILRGDEGVRALPQAAEEATRQPGTEITPARVAGREHGPAGRWVELRTRMWAAIRPTDPHMQGAHVRSEGDGHVTPASPSTVERAA